MDYESIFLQKVIFLDFEAPALFNSVFRLLLCHWFIVEDSVNFVIYYLSINW